MENLCHPETQCWTESSWGGQHLGSSITYYFAHNGEFTGFETNWTSTAQAGYRSALQSWANVANITFTEVSHARQRDLHRPLGVERFFGGGKFGPA